MHCSLVREQSGASANGDGNTYLDLEEFFRWSLDEESAQVNIGGKVIVGDRLKVKHEKVRDDSSISVTAVRSCSSAGQKGPLFYLLAGSRRIEAGLH